jgi:hypothetical protein
MSERLLDQYRQSESRREGVQKYSQKGCFGVNFRCFGPFLVILEHILGQKVAFSPPILLRENPVFEAYLVTRKQPQNRETRLVLHLKSFGFVNKFSII